MNYIILALVAFGVFIQSLLQKQYNIKMDGISNANYVFNFIMSAGALLVTGLIYCFNITFNYKTFLFSFCFAATFSVSIVFQFLAIKSGPFSLTSLFISFSLIIPTLYGIIFLKEKISVSGGMGIVFLIISLIMVNKYKSEQKILKRWFLYIALAFVGNGLCSTIQKMFQTYQNGSSFEFMFFAMLFATFVFLSLLFFRRPQKIRNIIKAGGGYAVGTGVTNAAVNLAMIYLASRLDASVLYPGVSAGGLALTFLFAVSIYKEKLNSVQYIGYFLGIVSIILLSL